MTALATSTQPSRGAALRNMKTANKLITSFLIVCAIMVMVGGIGIWGMGQLNDRVTRLADRDVASINALSIVREALTKIQRNFYFSIVDTSSSTSTLSSITSDEQTMNDGFNHYLLISGSPEADEQQAITIYEQNLQPWLDLLQTMTPLAKANTAADDAQVRQLAIAQWDPQTTKLTAALDHLITIKQNRATASRNDASATYARMVWTLGIVMVAALVLAITLGLWLARLIANPLQKMVTVAQHVADGDLQRIDALVNQYGGRDETGQLTLALDAMITSLRQLVGDIHTASTNIANASGQIADAAEQSGNATNQVAQTIQQVSTGVQEQATQLTTVSGEMDALKNAGQHVADASTETGRVAKNGAEVINETLTGMQAVKQNVSDAAQQVRLLAERSNAISTIATSIAEIADQTNLLALNAAIEAARAGEHGRGFAVVADEVRKLAERSSTATQDIAAIIAEVQQQITRTIETMETGVTHVAGITDRSSEAGHALQLILDTMQDVIQQAQTVAQGAERATHAVSNAASVSEENSASAEEVSAAAEEMAAQVEETVASTQTLNDLARQLRGIVQVFHMDDLEPEHAAPTALAAHRAGSGTPATKPGALVRRAA